MYLKYPIMPEAGTQNMADTQNTTPSHPPKESESPLDINTKITVKKISCKKHNANPEFIVTFNSLLYFPKEDKYVGYCW